MKSPTLAQIIATAKNGIWYSDAVAWAERNEILRDCINNDFDWHAPLTREQGIVTLHGYARFQGKDTGVRDDLPRYTDAGDISQWALEAFRWSVGADIVVGNTLTTLVPLATFTRAQSAMVFMKYFTLAP